MREALEDTGNKVAAVCIIGEREHPATSVHLVYVACRPPGRGPVDYSGAAALRWVTLDEADELASGTIYEPARAYLRREQGD